MIRFVVKGFDSEVTNKKSQAFTSYVHAVSKAAAKTVVAKRRAQAGRYWIRITECEVA